MIPNKSYKLLQEKSLQTEVQLLSINYYYQRNHWKQYLQTITREIIANYAYKSLWNNSIHFKWYFIFEAHNTDNSFKTIVRKFITNNAFKSCLNPTTSKAKGHITYQNANFSADNQQLQQS